MGEKRAVVYTVDDNIDCKLQMLSSIESVRTFLGGIDIIVLTTEAHPSYEGYLKVRTVNVRPYVEEFGLSETGIMWRGSHVSPMLLFRLIIPVVEELKEYSKILYLDSDIELWSSDAAMMFEFDNEGHEVTAVRDNLSNERVKLRMTGVKVRAETKDFPYYQRWDQVLAHRGYVNSGVLVFNMEKFRDETCADRMHAIVEQLAKRHPRYPDQDILNAYYDIFLVLDRRFNDWRQKAHNDSIIRHNVGRARFGAPVYPPRHAGRPDAKLASPLCHAYVVTEEVKSPLKGELKAFVKTEIVRTYQSPLFDLVKSLNVPIEMKSMDHLANWFGHYRACKLAMGSGYRKILIAESNWELNKEALDTVPADCDIAVFDGAVDDNGESTGTWVANDAGHRVATRSSKAYVLSRRAMESLVWLFESLMDPKTPDRRIRYIHKWLVPKVMRGKLRMYYWSK